MVAYSESILGPNEDIKFKASFHWLYTFNAICWLTLGSLIVIGPFLFIWMMFEKYGTEIVVTNQRFIYKRGIIRRDTREIALNSIEQVMFEQSFLGRLLDYGRVTVTGTGNCTIALPSIDDPIALRKALGDAIG